MKAITLVKTELNGKFYYEKWDGSIGNRDLDESEFLIEIDHAIDSGHFITITKDSLATTIHEHSKCGDEVFDGVQDADHNDSATTIKSIAEILDKAKAISDRNLSDEVCDMDTIDLPLFSSQVDQIVFEDMVATFCRERNLRTTEYVEQDAVINLIGEQ